MTYAAKKEISDFALGTCLGEGEIAEHFDVTGGQVLEAIVDVGEIERCDSCSWWVEANEIDDDQNCEDCQSSQPDGSEGEDL